MHILQSKHIKLKEKEILEVLERFNVSKAQLPKILLGDPALPEGCQVGDILRIERVDRNSEKNSRDKDMNYYRVVV